MRSRICHKIVIFSLTLLLGATAQAQSLRGSPAVMARQNQAAIDYGYSFLKTASEVQSFHEMGYLVKVTGNNSLEIHNVSYPFARPEVKTFLERLGAQYQAACGEKLYVTSLTRPLDRQPGNASDASVHPTGMAVDLRVPNRGRCRSWLESTLLSLERANVLDVTRERRPPHYHVALFTKTYVDYLARLQSSGSEASRYTVRRGDSLWLIASRHGLSMEALRAANHLDDDLLNIGQVLTLPAKAGSPATVSRETGNPETGVVEVAAVTESTHRVKKGESLWLIASRHRVSVDALRVANQLDNDLLNVGQVLTLPAKAGSPDTGAVEVAAVTEFTHRVRKGDSLWRIATRYGISVSRIQDENGLKGSFLQVGQVLKIRNN